MVLIEIWAGDAMVICVGGVIIISVRRRMIKYLMYTVIHIMCENTALCISDYSLWL